MSDPVNDYYTDPIFEWARRRIELRYSPDQPRDERGRFGEGSGSSSESASGSSKSESSKTVALKWRHGATDARATYKGHTFVVIHKSHSSVLVRQTGPKGNIVRKETVPRATSGHSLSNGMKLASKWAAEL